jgi:hypothetical protein
MGRIARNVVGVSVAECARQLAALHGITITDMAIHRAIKAGRVPRHPDGSVDVEAVRLGMQLTADPTRGGQRQAGVVGVMGGSPLLMVGDRGAADIQPSATATIADAQLQLLQARATGETALAQRRTLELSQMMGRVAEVEPMLRAVQDVVIAARSASRKRCRASCARAHKCRWPPSVVAATGASSESCRRLRAADAGSG